MAVHKYLMRKKSKEDEQNLAELNSAHRHSQAKCQFVQTSYIKQIKLFLFGPSLVGLYGRILTSVCVRSVLTTSVKILPYRSPARLTRAK